MLLLLVCSAFFSGAETAFFTLSRRQIKLLGKSKHKVSNLAANLLANPKQLLGCFLFGNMTVNVLFFAVSSVLVVRIEQNMNVPAAVVTAFLSFSVLVLLGEILPKLDVWLMSGIGFGATYPELVYKMWVNTYEIPIEYRQRVGGSKLNAVRVGFEDMFMILRLVFWRPRK